MLLRQRNVLGTWQRLAFQLEEIKQQDEERQQQEDQRPPPGHADAVSQAIVVLQPAIDLALVTEQVQGEENHAGQRDQQQQHEGRREPKARDEFAHEIWVPLDPGKPPDPPRAATGTVYQNGSRLQLRNAGRSSAFRRFAPPPEGGTTNAIRV